MQTVQLSIFLENRAGQLSGILDLLASHNYNIRALSLADTSDFGILRILVNNFDQAALLLLENGFTVGKTEVVAVEFDDNPGALATILCLLAPHEINVEYMYACARNDTARAIMIFRFDKTDEALNILKNHGYKLPAVTTP